jgi:hypothetical protein
MVVQSFITPFAIITLLPLVIACQGEPAKPSTFVSPYWQAKPELESDQPRFCEITKKVMTALPNSKNFKCQQKLQDAMGARVNAKGSEIVLLKGAENEWFMFAYKTEKKGGTILGEAELANLRIELEARLASGK